MDVVALTYRELPAIEFGQLARQKAALDQCAAYEQSLFDLADQIEKIDHMIHSNQHQGVSGKCDLLSHAASHLGLMELAFVATALAQLVKRQDFVATHAVARRLTCVGDRSLKLAVHLD